MNIFNKTEIDLWIQSTNQGLWGGEGWARGRVEVED